MSIAEAHARLDQALSAWRTDPRPANAPRHIDAALRATGDLQRALILCRLSYDNPIQKGGAIMAKKNPVKKPGKPPRC